MNETPFDPEIVLRRLRDISDGAWLRCGGVPTYTIAETLRMQDLSDVAFAHGWSISQHEETGVWTARRRVAV